MDFTEKKIREINRYEGIVVDVTMDAIELSNGAPAFREVVHHPGGVCVLPIDEAGNACCVYQFRYPGQHHLLEAPAGKLEKGEEPLKCAVRELSEETGITADELIPVGSYCLSPGYSTEVLHIFLARGLHRGDSHPDAGELLELRWIPLDELYGMVSRGEIPDAKTAIAVLQAERLFRKECQ